MPPTPPRSLCSNLTGGYCPPNSLRRRVIVEETAAAHEIGYRVTHALTPLVHFVSAFRALLWSPPFASSRINAYAPKRPEEERASAEREETGRRAAVGPRGFGWRGGRLASPFLFTRHRFRRSREMAVVAACSSTHCLFHNFGCFFWL